MIIMEIKLNLDTKRFEVWYKGNKITEASSLEVVTKKASKFFKGQGL